MKKLLYILLIVLIVIFLFAFLITTSKQDWISSLSGNLFSGTVGILITVALVDRIIEAQQEKVRQKYKTIAFRQLRLELLDQFGMFFNIFKSSVISKPEKDCTNMRDFFDEDYFEQIVFFDFENPSPVILPFTYGKETLWFDYVALRLNQFNGALNKTIEKYGIYLDSDTIDLIRATRNI